MRSHLASYLSIYRSVVCCLSPCRVLGWMAGVLACPSAGLAWAWLLLLVVVSCDPVAANRFK